MYYQKSWKLEQRAPKFYVLLSMGVGLSHINKGAAADCL